MINHSGLMKIVTGGLAVLLVLGTWVDPAGAEELDENRKSLEEIQRRIRDTARKLEQKQAEKGSLAEELKSVEKELRGLTSRVATLNKRVDSLDRDIKEKEQQLVEARQDMAALEKQVRKRLVALYKGGETGLLRVLFTNDSPLQVAEDYHFWNSIVRRDRDLLATYQKKLESLRAKVVELEGLRRNQQNALVDRRHEQETLQEASRLKERLLARVNRDEKALAGRLEELRERARRVGSLIKKLESQKSPEYTEKTGVFAGQKGRLPWPSDGPLKVGFGTGRHPELGTLFESNGIEIGVSGEQPIAAVWGGRVAFANWFKGYGNLLIIDHGDSYYTLYAQAARLTKRVGETVRPGETVGFSGFEGSRTIYFEIRKGGTPQNPEAWLKKR